MTKKKIKECKFPKILWSSLWVFFFFFTVVHLFVKAQFGGCHCDIRITVNLLCCNRHGTEDKTTVLFWNYRYACNLRSGFA